MNLDIHPPLPRRKDFRIGVLGSGFIVNDCHLVSYRKAGFNPVAIGDLGWCQDPYTSPSTIRFARPGDAGFQSPVLPDGRFPNAFIGTMSQDASEFPFPPPPTTATQKRATKP